MGQEQLHAREQPEMTVVLVTGTHQWYQQQTGAVVTAPWTTVLDRGRILISLI